MRQFTTNYNFLQGGGQMGQSIRSKNWDQIPLRNPEHWPQSLRTTVSTILQNPVPMAIAWGTDYVQLFNDGYHSILNKTQHPSDVGIPFQETFSEFWPIFEQKFLTVMEGQSEEIVDLVLSKPKNNTGETTSFDFAFSPIWLENDDVGGVLITVLEKIVPKKLDDTLSINEERFKNIADSMPNLSWMGSKEGAIYWYNKQWYSYTGTTADEVMGWEWQNVIHPDYTVAVLKEWKAALASGTSFELVYPILGKDGVYKSFISRALPIKDQHDEIIGWFGTNTDMSLQKQTEEALSDSKNALEFALEAAQLGTFDYNPFTNKFSANRRLKNWFGLSAHQKVDLSHALDTIIESDKTNVINAIQTALEFSSGGLYDIEYRITNPITNKEIWLHAKGKAWFTKDKIAYRFNGTVEDVTAKTNARRLTALNEVINKNMVLEAPIGICVIDAATLIIENVNDHFVEIVGKDRDQIYQKPYWDTFAEAKSSYEKQLEKVITTGTPFSINEVEVFLIRHGKLETLVITFYYSPLKNPEGKVTKIAVWVINHTTEVVARNKIAESDANLKLMILQAPIAISILRGSDYKVEIVNKNNLELWGRTEEEVLYQSIFDSMPELENQGIRQILDNVVSTGVRYSTKELEVTLIRNGVQESIYVNFSYEPLHDGQNRITGIMCIGIDVSEQVFARKKAIENEQSIRALVESAPFPIAVLNGKEMEITLANQSIIDAWGKGNDVIGKSFKDILPEFKSQEIFTQIETVFNTGIAFHKINQRIEIQHDNTLNTYYYNYSLTPLFDAEGRIYAVMNTAAEVTALHKAQQKIEESEKRFRKSLYQAPLGIAIFRGPNFVTEIANENYLNLVDKTEAEFIGIPLFEALPEVKDVVLPLFSEILTTSQPFYADELSVHLRRGDKVELHYFNLVYHPLLEENGAVSGIMVVATEVTNTVQAKLLLQESESHFRHMVMQSPNPITILRGNDFIIESANVAMLEQIWQRKREDVIGKRLVDAFPELKDQKYMDLLNSVFNSGVTHSEKESFVIVKSNDKVREFYLDFEYAPIFELDGKINAIMITANDVTDNVAARKKVEIAEERLRLATESTGIATWELDLVNQNFVHSRRMAEIFGFEISATISVQQIDTMFHPDDEDRVAKAREVAKLKGLYNHEARIIKSDGSITWIRTQGKIYFNEKRAPYRIIGTTQDINDEIALQQVLVESEAKFRLLADTIPQHIWTADPQGTIFYFNQFVFSYSGLSINELEKDGWMQIVHPEDREENVKHWMESIATGNDFLQEHRFRKEDGTYRWQLSRAVPQRDEDGKIMMWVGTSTDIQDQKMFTEELEKSVTERTSEINQKNDDLEKMNKELQSFAYISSHDLQEPLRKIQIFASQIISKEAENLSAAGLEKFDRIRISANRMQTLIQDLLVYSRASFQERILEHTTLDAVIAEVTEDLSEELLEKNAEIHVLHSCEIQIITLQFRQLLFNLISNSLKFTRENTPPIVLINSKIALGSTFENKLLIPDQLYCHISVRDNGVGFSQEYHEKIFEVFQRLHAKEQFAGTGIGLAIVKKIVENHNGFISASSVLNEGAQFDVYIPA